jgi:hypothetical protein
MILQFFPLLIVCNAATTQTREWLPLNPIHAIDMPEASETKAKNRPFVNINGRKVLDRRGKRYGILTALTTTKFNSRKQAFWKCLCDCGTTCEVFGGNLNSGHTTSCGCQKGFFTHREGGAVNFVTRSPEYQTLCSMLQRCNNPSSQAYKYYGGKGVKICDEWNGLDKYLTFLSYMGRRPSRAHSIDRWPNREGNYEPGNVRWATPSEQTRNTSRNVMVVFQGRRMCLTDAAKQKGVKPQTLQTRIASGLSPQQAVDKPMDYSRHPNKKYERTN